ncbi:MAG TPA: cytochrome P450 [Pseudomonadales bacterium]|nr:cytochrome P450 [Pseudomonadales bacterium]
MPNRPFPEEDIIATEYYGQHSHPYEIFKWLRANEPLRYFTPEGFAPFWAATTHDDITEIEKIPEIFLSAPRTQLLPSSMLEAAQQQAQSLGQKSDQPLFRSLVNMDPPDHKQFRQLVMPWFRPVNLSRLETRLEEITKDLIDEMMGDGSVQECDFVQDVAVWGPLRLICELLGVPHEDEDLLLKLTNEIFAGEDPEMNRTKKDSSGLMTTIMDLITYFTKVTADRRANPTEDLCSYIANGKIDGEYLSDPDLFGYYIIVVTAGHETTRTAIAGGLKALLDHPEQMQKLIDNPDLMKLGVEEMIRWTIPVVQFCRVASKDYRIRDKTIREGESVALFYASASRDEAVFTDGDEFRVDRQPNKHLAFGTGPHLCLGTVLARMEMRIFFSQLLPRIEQIELIGEADYLQASFVHGIKHLPIRYKLRPALN